MHQVRRGVVAHDVMAAVHIDFCDGLVTNLGLARDHLADMHDHARGRSAHIA